MMQEGQLFMVSCRPVPYVSPVSADSSQRQPPLPTPSPFSFSVATTRWSSVPSIHVSDLFLRSLAFLFSFVSAISLASSSSEKKGQKRSSFAGYSELVYCFIVSVLVFVYSFSQLLKGCADIARRGFLISGRISDYVSFIIDQLVSYLLISSCSVAILAIQRIDKAVPLWKGAIVSSVMSCATFMVVGSCTLLSGYKLCKRIIW